MKGCYIICKFHERIIENQENQINELKSEIERLNDIVESFKIAITFIIEEME